MTFPDVTLAIATCVNPTGLRRLLDSVATSRDLPGRILVCLDGNDGWERLDRMAGTRGRFSATDRARIERDNQETPTYGFLAERAVHVVRHAVNRGPVAAFNALFAAAYMAGYVALVNDDVEVRDAWLGPLVAVMRDYPTCVLTGYSNLDVSKRPGFPALPGICHMGAAPLIRGTYVRELINHRGWVEDPRFTMLKTDIQRMCEPAGRGHDVVCVADPIPIVHHAHRSLGDWTRDAIQSDQTRDIAYPVNHGARGMAERVGRYRFVRAIELDGLPGHFRFLEPTEG